MSGLLPEPSGVPDVAESKDVAHPDLRAAMARVELRQAASRVSEANEKCLEEPKEVYEAVFGRWASTHGKVISKRERDASGMNASSLVYGEIQFRSFGLTLEKIKNVYGKPGVGTSGARGVMQTPGEGVFYDLGSGAGKPVVAAAALFAFERCVGVEFLPGLVKASLDAKATYEAVGAPLLEAQRGAGGAERAPAPAVDFFEADVTDLAAHDWSHADVVFTNSTCFDDSMMVVIARKAAKLKKGAFFITFTKKLPSVHFDVRESQLYQMSWGGATVFIQQKTDDPLDIPATDDTPVSAHWSRCPRPPSLTTRDVLLANPPGGDHVKE